MKTVSNILGNYKKYAKSIVAVTGLLAALGVAVLASPLAAVIPVGVVGWITTGTSFLTAVGVWWARNEHLVEEVVDEIEDVLPSGVNAHSSSGSYLRALDPPTESFPVAGS